MARGGLNGESSETSTVYSSGAVGWSVSFGAQTVGGELRLIDSFGHETRSVSGTPLGTHTFDVTVNFDSWVSLNVTAAATLGTFDYGALGGFYNPGTASIAALFSHTFEFVGINELHDSAGNLIEFTAFDEDGRDYRIGATVTPVPEPSTYALMLAGLAVVGFASRRRRAVAQS